MRRENMSTFTNAVKKASKPVQKKVAPVRTTNGMKAEQSTNHKCVDLFYNIGASRGKDILPAFKLAYAENAELAVRIALWARDIRGGAGERELFRKILKFLSSQDTAIALRMLPK